MEAHKILYGPINQAIRGIISPISFPLLGSNFSTLYSTSWESEVDKNKQANNTRTLVFAKSDYSDEKGLVRYFYKAESKPYNILCLFSSTSALKSIGDE